MTDRTILSNARLILPDTVLQGTITLENGVIADIAGGPSRTGIDCDGDLIAPGLVELHTDNLERHIFPRPKAEWPHAAAILAHDAELAGCGITTVFDAIRIGSIPSRATGMSEYARGMATEIGAARDADALKISHHLHLRCELGSETLVAELAGFGPADRVGFVSLMDHTPGQRQYADASKFTDYIRGKYGLSEAEVADYVDFLCDLRDRHGPAHLAAAIASARHWGATLASHDDSTAAQVAQSAAQGVLVAEFPTTRIAAQACRDAGIAVMMGAPNLVRGGSHSGNVAARDLGQAGLLDILSSDYVPASLLLGAVMLGELWGDMARGLATVTAAPAAAVGLTDRGTLAVGQRADVIRIRHAQGSPPILRGTWVQGVRVA